MYRFATILLAVMSSVHLTAPFRVKSGHVVGEAVQVVKGVNKTEETASVPRLPSAETSVEKKHTAHLSVAAEEIAAEAVAAEDKAATEKTTHQRLLKERSSQTSVVSLNVGEALQDAGSRELDEVAAPKAEKSADAADQHRSGAESSAEQVAEENVEKAQHIELLSKSQRYKILKELKEQQNDPDLEGKISWGPKWKGDDLTTEMVGIIIGPPGSPYENAIFSLKLRIPLGYPFEPPSCQFTTRIYHPNVNSNGSVSLGNMEDKWVPSVGISGALKIIWSLVEHPNPYDPQEPEIAQQYINERDQFNQIANEWKIRHATSLVG